MAQLSSSTVYGDLLVTADGRINKNLMVDGTATIGVDLTVKGDTTIDGNLIVNARLATFGDDLSVVGDVDVGGNLLVNTGYGKFNGSLGTSQTQRGVYIGVSSANDPQIQLQGAGEASPHIDFSNGTEDYDARLILVGDNTLQVAGAGLDVEGPASATSFVVGTNTLKESTDRAGLLQIKSTTTGWGGIQISNASDSQLWSYMADGSSSGIYNDTDSQWYLRCQATGSADLLFAGSTKLQTATGGVAITGTLTTTVDVSATGNVIAYASDGRLKDIVEHLDPDTALKQVLSWDKVKYTWNETANRLAGFNMDKIEIGLLADKVSKDYPEVTPLAPFDNNPDGNESLSGENYKTLDYGRLVAVQAAAIEGLNNKVEMLMQTVEDLKAQLH
ncbi:hypothetical protein VPHD479_0346 [Vibrio phage D479]